MRFFNLDQIQHKSPATKMRILFATVFVMAILLFGVWLWSTSKEVNKIDNPLAITDQTQTSPLHKSITLADKFVKVEWIEHKNNQLKIYFKVTNNTNDILSFSKVEDINLTYDGPIVKAQSLQDRQGGAFVQKILSKTEKYGVVAFEDNSQTKAVLNFDNLYFETAIETIITENVELDLKELNKPIEIR